MCLLTFLASQAFAWPADAAWSPLTGAATLDDDNDRLNGGIFLELVGTADDPTGWWAVDADAVYFRIHVGEDPEGAAGQLDYGAWGIALDTDADPTTLEYGLEAATSFGSLSWFENTSATPGIQPALTFEEAVGSLASGEVRPEALSVSGSGSYLDVQISRAKLLSYGIDDSTVFRVGLWTRDPSNGTWSDTGGCIGTVGCLLADSTSDPLSIDADADGLLTPDEVASGTDPKDADTDDDGLNDGDEALFSTSPLDPDTDDDGISDGTEAGVAAAGPDTDPAAGMFTPDADPGTTTDPLSADTDGGGLPDGTEDWDRDGARGTWETDPNDPSDDADADGDGIPDVFDGDGGNPVSDVDSDGDGLIDASEWLFDTDSDGTPDFLDDDSDGDGLPDADEGQQDPDGDGIPNNLDPDSDNDGLTDGDEGDFDTDGDGYADFLDTDSDGDGIGDAQEPPGDLDGDGADNGVDTDANGDGVLDGDQQGDSDYDGTPDWLEEDSDGDGIPNTTDGLADVDGDGLPNAVDTDSDGDGTPDADEGVGDFDCDGLGDWIDADNFDAFCDTGQPIPTVDTGLDDTDGNPVESTDKADGGGCDTGGGRGGIVGWLLAMAALGRLTGRQGPGGSC